MDIQHTKKTLKNTTANVDAEIYKNQDNVLTGKQYLLLIPLTRFFCQTENIDKLKNILDGKSKLSLRLVDWFVTNYSKKNLVMYNLKKMKRNALLNKEKKQENNIEIKDDCSEVDSGVELEEQEYFSDYFNVFSDYRGQLKSLNKKNFDPFCRRERIKFFYGKADDDYIITTVGQLNFFKWSIENYILEHIEANMKVIEDDMNKFTYSKKFILEKTKKKTDIGTGCKKGKGKRKYNKKKKTSEKGLEKQTKKNTEYINDCSDTKELNEIDGKKKKATRRKRKELSISANKSFVIHNLKAVINFD
uniref:Uncharacterized protein n=1 Tax=viral metagenome TaxID=1070528 RepID=A0A6C0EHL5_9ZZZZ